MSAPLCGMIHLKKKGLDLIINSSMKKTMRS